MHIVSRIGASLLGGWTFVWGFAVLGTVLLPTTGMSYSDAQTLVGLLAFLVFLIAFCWAYVARSATRAWVALAGGGGVMTAAAWLLAH